MAPGKTPRGAICFAWSVEGRNIALEWRDADGLLSRAVELPTERARMPVEVIAAHHTPAVKASMTVTSPSPIVVAPAAAPLQAGLLESLARRGGNVTGLSSMEAKLGRKRLDLLLNIIPGLARVAVLGAKTDPFTTPCVQDVQSVATDLGLSSDRDTTPAGGLISCSADHSANFRRTATFVDKSLKGSRPAELPVEQPTKCELVINARWAHALDLAIPPSMLITGDEGIR